MAWITATALTAAILGAPEAPPPPESAPVDARTTPPRILPGNQAAINNCYSRSGKRRGGEGRTVVEATIAPDGSVGDVQLAPGILPWQEQTARCVIGQMRFEPGRHDGEPVAARIQFPIVFSLQDVAGSTSLVTDPKLRSTHEEIEDAYRACYPADMVSIARPQYSVTIDTKGRVTASKLVESSGDDALDRAGTCMFERIRFDPATRDDRPVSATLTLPMLVRPPK
jgi:TonB family protein